MAITGPISSIPGCKFQESSPDILGTHRQYYLLLNPKNCLNLECNSTIQSGRHSHIATNKRLTNIASSAGPKKICELLFLCWSVWWELQASNSYWHPDKYSTELIHFRHITRAPKHSQVLFQNSWYIPQQAMSTPSLHVYICICEPFTTSANSIPIP